MTEAAYWRTLKKIGWLEYLPESHWSSVRAQLKRNLKGTGKDAHLALAQEAFEPGESSPAEFLHKLADLSGGAFAPRNVKVDQRSMSFAHRGRKYTCHLSGAIAEGELLDRANASLADAGIRPRFIVLPSSANSFACLVFVPPEVYARAVEAKLIHSKGYLSAVVAPSSDADVANASARRSKEWPKISLSEMSPGDIAELLKLLGLAAGKSLTKSSGLSDRSTSAFALAVEATRQLAALPDTRVLATAKRWTKTPSLKAWLKGEVDTDWLTDRLVELRDLARQAVSPQHRLLFYWRPV